MKKEIKSIVKKVIPQKYRKQIRDILNINGFNQECWVLDAGRIFGTSFKEYFITNNMIERIACLKNGLDNNSKLIVDRKIDIFLNVPLMGNWAKHFRIDSFDDIFLSKEEKNEKYMWLNEEEPKLHKKIKGEFHYTKLLPPESFMYHHGLKGLGKKAITYLSNKTFLDIGPYKGDSSLIFNEYNPAKVLAFELMSDLKEEYYKNLKLNNIDISKYQFINKGVSDKFNVVFPKNCSLENSTEVINSENCVSTHEMGGVELIVLDEYLKEKNENIGLIKMDIEGAEYSAIKGAKNIIKNNRPIIISAIYHTPTEFFELKPLLEKIVDNYIYKIVNCSFMSCEQETTLIAVPKELV